MFLISLVSLFLLYLKVYPASFVLAAIKQFVSFILAVLFSESNVYFTL